MELKFYIESGIIESYVLGLASETEVEELEHMRKLFPELDTEVELAERRLERACFDEAVLPPVEIRERVLQKVRWEYAGAQADAQSNYTVINIQPQDGSHISVHRWWKIFFIIIFILSKIFLFFAILYYLKYRQEKEKQEERAAATVLIHARKANIFYI